MPLTFTAIRKNITLATALATIVLPVVAHAARPVAPRYDHDTLANQQADVFELVGGDFVLWIPPANGEVRGVLFLAGGPDTRAFADPRRSFGIPPALGADVDANLSELRTGYRQLAEQRGLAILGIRRDATPDVEAALQEAATVTSRSELRSAPLLMHGFSAGSRAVTRVASRLSARTIGMVLRVPIAGIWDDITRAPHGIPVLVLTAAQDKVVANAPSLSAFRTARQNGGLWAYVSEPGVGHYELTPRARALIVGWMESALDLREPQPAGTRLRDVGERQGLLGDPLLLGFTPWAAFTGERRTASWFPTAAVAALAQAVAR